MARGRQGFASMGKEQARAIQRKGGQAAHQQQRAHEYQCGAEACDAGRKGGLASAAQRRLRRQVADALDGKA